MPRLTLVVFALVLGVVMPAGADGVIHDAAMHGDVQEVRSFLADGADPDARDEDGNTPLQMAAYNGRVQIAHTLRTFGARER